MSDLTVDGLPVLRGDILWPRIGTWTADLVLESDRVPSGSVVLASSAGLRLVGWVEGADVTAGRVEVRIRAGRGQLGKELAPVAYRPVGGVRVRAVLEDLARDSGEALSSRIERELLDGFVPAWSRERGTTTRALRALALELGCSWRIDSDGGILLVRERWPEVDPESVTLLRSDPINDAVELGLSEIPSELQPGVSWQGRRVSSMELFVLDGGAVRARLLFELEGSPLLRDRVASKYNLPQPEQIEASVYLGTYLARVVAQSADLATVDVELEPDVPPDKRKIAGLVRVPLYAATPGAAIELRIADTTAYLCLVAFLNGDRQKPAITGWLGSPSSNVEKRAKRMRVRGEEIQLGEGGARKVARNNDPTGNGALTITSIPGAMPVNPKLNFTYMPPGGAPQTVSIEFMGGVPSGSGTITISGEITDGSATLTTD